MAIITVDDAQDTLNIPGTLTAEQTAEIQQFIDAATVVVEDIVGSMDGAVSYTEHHRGGRPVIPLRQRNPVAFTSVKEYTAGSPTTLTAAATPDVAGADSFTVDYASSTITRRESGGGVQDFADEVWVTYTAGIVSPPANVIRATCELVARAYGESQQGGLPAFEGEPERDEPLTSTPSGFLIPERVLQWLTPHAKELGGFA